MGKEQKINEIKCSIDYRSIGASYKKLSMDYRKEIKDDSSPGQYVQRCIAEKLLQKSINKGRLQVLFSFSSASS